jgi:RNA polymerase sigma factor (sigma-70 family)
MMSTASRAMLSPPSQMKQPIKSDHPLYRLTHEEEMSLLRKMRSHSADTPESQAARQTLLLHNLPLVQSIVSKAMRCHPRLLVQGTDSQVGVALSMDDLLNEGTIGLIEALDKYDFSFSELQSTDAPYPHGARLGTYATYWIRARITRAIQSREHTFRFPERTLQASHRLVKAARVLELEWSTVLDLQNADTAEKERLRSSLCGAAAISSEAQFREAIRVRNMSYSTTTTLESWMSPSSNSANPSQFDVNESLDSGCQHIHDTLSKFLGPKEVQVLSLRYGLACPGTENDSVSTTKSGLYRDYQAEAEEDLFGPSGILSHYSDVPLEQSSTSVASDLTSGVAVTKSSTATATSATIKATGALSTLTKSHRINLSTTSALLPFKEVGKKMKISGEYCRRLCGEALRKLSLAAEEGRLAESDFLLGW